MFSGITYAIENGSDIVVKDPGSFLDSTWQAQHHWGN